MLRRTFVLTACAVAMATLLTSSSTQAQGAIKTNYLTFNGPVALPGVVLTPGRYAFESGPQGTNASLVRVTSADHHRVHFVGFATPSPRPANMRPGELLLLGEATRGEPTPIRAWYPINASMGHQFRW